MITSPFINDYYTSYSAIICGRGGRAATSECQGCADGWPVSPRGGQCQSSVEVMAAPSAKYFSFAHMIERCTRPASGSARGWCDTAIINRSDLWEPRAGPCIIEEYDSTCVLPPGSTANLDPFENIVIDVGATRPEPRPPCRGNRIARKRGRRLARWLKSRLSSRAKHTPLARGSAQLAQ